ncbi:MAG: hypothetical protein ACK5MA_06110, partial [Parachlamydiaceae bacterium]
MFPVSRNSLNPSALSLKAPFHHETAADPQSNLRDKLKQLGVIDEAGIFLLPLSEIPGNLISNERLNQLLNRTIRLVSKDEKKEGPEIHIKTFLDAKKHPNNRPICTYLRGTSAFYVMDLPALFEAFLPDASPFEEELKRITDEWLNMPLPNDLDILETCEFVDGLAFFTKKQLAEQAELSIYETKFFFRKWADARKADPLYPLPQNMLITTIGSKEFSLDRVIGEPRILHQFSMNNLRIRLDGTHAISPESQDLAQTVIDRLLKIVRYEPRHLEDFQSTLAALQHFSNGYQIIDKTNSLPKAFENAETLRKNIPGIIKSIQNRIQSHQGDWLFFLMTVCAYLERALTQEEVGQIFDAISNDRKTAVDLPKGTYQEVKEALYSIGILCPYYRIKDLPFRSRQTEQGLILRLNQHRMLLTPPLVPVDSVALLQKQTLPLKQMTPIEGNSPPDCLRFNDPRLNLLLERARQKPMTPLSPEFLDALVKYFLTTPKREAGLEPLLHPYLVLKDSSNWADLSFALLSKGYAKQALNIWLSQVDKAEQSKRKKPFFETLLSSPRSCWSYFKRIQGILPEDQLKQLFQAMLKEVHHEKLLKKMSSLTEFKALLFALKESKIDSEAPLLAAFASLPESGNYKAILQIIALWRDLFPSAERLLEQICSWEAFSLNQKLKLLAAHAPISYRLLEPLFSQFKDSQAPLRYLLDRKTPTDQAPDCWEAALRALNEMETIPHQTALEILENRPLSVMAANTDPQLPRKLFKSLQLSKLYFAVILKFLETAIAFHKTFRPVIASHHLARPDTRD